MSSIEQARTWNNEAIAFLQRGEPSAAIEKLKKALGVMMAISDDFSTSNNDEEQQQQSVSVSSTCVIQSVNIPVSPTVTIDAAALENDSSLFVLYSRAFELAPQEHETGFHCGLVVILFNLAFGFDTLALHNKTNPNLTQAKLATWHGHAIKLYRLALQVASSRSKEEVASIRCVLLAASNNMGRLCHSFVETKDCLRLSLDLIGTRDTARHLNQEDYELLFRTLAPFLCVKDFLLPVAPAA